MRSGPTRDGVLACAVGLAISGGAAWGGGSGENLVLIVDPLNAESMYVANYYRRARNVPDANIVHMTPGASNYPAFVSFNLEALEAAIARRGIDDQADYIVVMPGAPFFVNAPGLVTDACSPVTRFSITGAYTTAFIAPDVLDGAGSNMTNRYARGTYDPYRFDSQTAYLGGLPSNDSAARRYYLGAMLGYTGERGNTLAEVLANIDRSVAVDFTRPVGTFYFMETNDAARSGPRDNAYPTAVANLIALGGQASHELRWLPQNEHDCQGILTGMAAPDLPNGSFTVLPGAYCDHLTSWAATFDIADQTKVSAWIAKGATASWGAVEEPCNYAGKFPHARMQVYYYKGASMGESVFRAAGFVPFQGLLYGDPICRPFDYPVSVTVDDAPADAVSGVVELTPMGTTSKPDSFVLEYDVLVDNRQVARDFVKPIAFDTTTLEDGWHDLRVVGYDTSLVQTHGTWTGELVVNNLGRSTTISPQATGGDLSTTLAFDAASIAGGVGGAPVEIRLVQHGRVLASIQGCEGVLRTTGLALGAGRSRVQAEALFADGMRVRSAPVEVDIAYANGTPSGDPPTASGQTIYLAPGESTLVELPFADDDAGDVPTFEVLTPPANATITPGPAGPYRLLTADADATGFDSLTFRAVSGRGASGEARVVIVYTNHPLDRTLDARLTHDDLHHLNQHPADVNFDGAANGSDVSDLERTLRCGELRDMIPAQ